MNNRRRSHDIAHNSAHNSENNKAIRDLQKDVGNIKKELKQIRVLIQRITLQQRRANNANNANNAN